MLSNMDTDDLELEESECFSPVSSVESSEESVSYKDWNCNPSSVDSAPEVLNPSPMELPKKRKTKPPSFLQKLYYREIGGFISSDGCKNSYLVNKPSFQRIRLSDILPLSASKLNHVFLGMSKCGQFLLSYTFTTELDVMSFNTVYKYRLHWWAFSPHERARKVSEVMLFGNHGIYSTLYIAVCQWPMDYTRVLIYGNCCETYMGSVSQAERSYLTITTVPSLNKCQDCLKVAASYEEEDLAANWDSCVRFSCLKHSLTVHSTFDVVSPYPKFDPAVSMKRDGTVVFNTGNQLHVLRAELEYMNGSSPQITSRSDPVEPNSAECLVEPSSNDNTQIKQSDVQESHEHWIEEQKPLFKSAPEKCSEQLNVPHLSCPYNTRSHSLSPSVSSISCEKRSDCKDGANISYMISCSITSTSECPVEKNKFEEEDDDVDEDDVLEARKCSEFESKHSLQNSSDHKAGFADGCDMCHQLYCTHFDDRDSDKISIYTRRDSDGLINSNCFKKSCDTSKPCDSSSGRPERNNGTEGAVEEDLDIEVSYFRKHMRPVEEFWSKDNCTIDSTQELNISCGNINSFSDGNQSTVTLMSPVQKSLLVVSSSDEGRYTQTSDTNSDSKNPSSPPRQKRVRYGTTVKLSSPLPPSQQPKPHSKMAAEAEKAYEFTDDVPDTTGEKLSSYRRRRLADKKYEFIDEGEDLENIVPYRLHRRREPARHRSPPLHISPSPVILNHRRRIHEVDSEDGHFTGSWVSSLSAEIHSTASHPDPDKVVLRPLNQNTSGPILLSPRDRDSVSSDRAKTNNSNNKKSVPSEVVTATDDVQTSAGTESSTEGLAAESSSEGALGGAPAQCTVQLKRHYIEVDDELISVITDIEDDDVNEGIGYHCALPLEVHGAGYVQLQMISNSKAEKLMAPCVMVLQRSFDVEQFCHKIAERLCEEAGKKYWFCNDYDVEIVDVCPFSGDVIALAMMRIQATVKTKGLAKSQRHPVSSQQRRQYQGGCQFVWNLDSGVYSVVDTKPLTEVDPYPEEKDPWNPARDLARQLRQQLPQVPVYHSVRYICNRPVLRGISASRLEDLDNMIELVLH